MLTLEVLINQVFKPERGSSHDPKRYRLAKFVFVDISRLKDIIVLLNSISTVKIDFRDICSRHPMYLKSAKIGTTTIQINVDQRDILNELKLHPRESYADVINRILYERATQEK